MVIPTGKNASVESQVMFLLYGNTSSSFHFPFGKRGGGLRPTGNTKPEEKLGENKGGGLGINLRKTLFLKNLRYFCIAPTWLYPTWGENYFKEL